MRLVRVGGGGGNEWCRWRSVFWEGRGKGIWGRRRYVGVGLEFVG